jgi:hypothetical protein
MRSQAQSIATSELSACWQKWTRVVELFAKRKRDHLRVVPSRYAKLHTKLLQICEARASVIDPEKRAYYRNLEHLARPWVSPKSFLIADRQILDELLTHCRQIERELGGRAWILPDMRGLLRLLLIVVACVAGLFLVNAASRAWFPMIEHGRTWSEAIHMCIERSRYGHSLLIPSLLVVTISCCTIHRTAGS